MASGSPSSIAHSRATTSGSRRTVGRTALARAANNSVAGEPAGSIANGSRG
ncbi:Uncharacterised protein [Mycobacteroides abscessus subsp. abscessus]|nr:Uncharacterised protein [Mycobacteroides abscessus subsp. abscessus]